MNVPNKAEQKCRVGGEWRWDVLNMAEHRRTSPKIETLLDIAYADVCADYILYVLLVVKKCMFNDKICRGKQTQQEIQFDRLMNISISMTIGPFLIFSCPFL